MSALQPIASCSCILVDLNISHDTTAWISHAAITEVFYLLGVTKMGMDARTQMVCVPKHNNPSHGKACQALHGHCMCVAACMGAYQLTLE